MLILWRIVIYNTKDIYNSITFIEKWQNLITDIRDCSINLLNDYCDANEIEAEFSVGLSYPKQGIHYGNYIDCCSKRGRISNVVYFGFNFNLYDKKNIKSYPDNDTLGKQINNMLQRPETLTDELSDFIEAKKDEIIDKFIFGVAFLGSELNDNSRQFCNNHSIEDKDGNFYIPVPSHLLYENNSIALISERIFQICKEYLFTGIIF